ncbi:hypothetical protein AB0L05_34650 [Nonomuraea pusilla]|uniref:hypothetical protein n=1 Tax=Nonomuraea pusilla TaxID=46177 RepID=UPI00331FD5DA
MDVTSPSPAPAPSRPSTLRRLGVALAGVAVAALTGAACALSFDDLRALAIAGEARRELAYLYPAAFDALLVVALVGVLLLRAAKPLVRAQAAVVLVLLLGAAAAADVATALRVSFDPTRAAVGVALAPWVMLAVALWVWLLLIKHVQTARAAADAAGPAAGAGGEDDIVPFRRTGAAEEAPPLTAYPAEQVLRPTPVVGPTPAPETPPVSEPRPVSVTRPPAETSPVSERVTEWPAATARAAAREPESRRKQDAEPGPLPAPPATEPAPGPERRPRPAARETAEPEPKEAEPKEAERRSEPTPAAEPEVMPEPEPTPEAVPEAREERRRVRWGDRVKPSDVLVHPLRDRGPDTQPVPVVPVDEKDPREPRQHHADDHAEDRAEVRADDREGVGGETAEGSPEEALEDTAPHPAVTDDPPPPAKRVRSTPRPPED